MICLLASIGGNRNHAIKMADTA